MKEWLEKLRTKHPKTFFQIANEVLGFRKQLTLGHQCARRYLRQGNLRVGNTGIGAGGVGRLAAVLPQCLSLARLDLHYNYIGEEGVAALAAVLPQCTSLAHLDLSENGIGAEGAGRLAVVLGQCTIAGAVAYWYFKPKRRINTVTLARNDA